jgi:hypothetical protein
MKFWYDLDTHEPLVSIRTPLTRRGRTLLDREFTLVT